MGLLLLWVLFQDLGQVENICCCLVVNLGTLTLDFKLVKVTSSLLNLRTEKLYTQDK